MAKIIFLLVNLFIIPVFSQVIDVTKPFGVLLPADSKPVEGNGDRYLSSQPFDTTARYFYFRFNATAGINKMPGEINLPHLRFVSYKNEREDAQFSFINIYLDVATGITNISFIKKPSLDEQISETQAIHSIVH